MFSVQRVYTVHQIGYGPQKGPLSLPTSPLSLWERARVRARVRARGHRVRVRVRAQLSYNRL